MDGLSSKAEIWQKYASYGNKLASQVIAHYLQSFKSLLYGITIFSSFSFSSSFKTREELQNFILKNSNIFPPEKPLFEFREHQSYDIPSQKNLFLNKN